MRRTEALRAPLRIAPLALVATLLLGGCGGGNAPQAASPPASPSAPASAQGGGNGAECPHLTSAQVSEAMGIQMQVSLAFETDCEWLAVDDTAISASLTVLTPEEVAQHSDETPVPGIGDEAYVDEGLLPTLWVRVGDKGYEVTATDLNDTGRLDAGAAIRNLGRLLSEG